MISIIISSYKDLYFKQISLNIDKTIGVSYEIIKIENPGLYSITEAYNKGAKKAKFDILCFVHEDVKFHSHNWGQNLLNHFKNNVDLGLIGIAGSTEKLLIPGGWGHLNKDKNKIHILQHNKKGRSYKISSYSEKNLEYLKVIDGVFLVTKKSIWNEIPFDESIRGYHLYDIDFSLQIAQKYKVAIVYDILIEHFSPGNFSDDWIEQTIKYHKNQNKKYLFDHKDDSYLLTRKSYYLLLANSTVSFKYKLIYIKNLGIDLYSVPAIFVFVFPKTGKFFVKKIITYKKFLNIKKIRYQKKYLKLN